MAQPGMVAPDGRFGCVTTAPNEPWVYLCTVDATVSTVLPRLYDSSKWMALEWTGDGRQLRVSPRENTMTRQVSLLDLASGAVTPWRELGGQVDRAGLQLGWRMHFSADGESYAYSFQRRLSTLYVVDGLR